MRLTEKQTDLLVQIGQPDDGIRIVAADGTLQELIKLGLVQATAEDSFDLSDAGRRVFNELQSQF